MFLKGYPQPSTAYIFLRYFTSSFFSIFKSVSRGQGSKISALSIMIQMGAALPLGEPINQKRSIKSSNDVAEYKIWSTNYE